MSKSIDERVVSMEFDNSNFEKNVSTTMSTLDRLKESLKMDGASKGLEEVDKNARKIDLSHLGADADSVGVKFNALQVMATTCLTNITNAAYQAGSRMIKALTIDPIRTGFQEYELKMGSVQTILAGAKDKNGMAVTLEEVNRQLEELNKYSDQTIYSFQDMTSNIGKFTNAGVDLETAVAAIKGVSNEAAISGANAQEASRAMYNFAQALSAGYVKLIDWKSIENANMATVDFKNQLLETAVAIGTVQQNADGMYTVLTQSATGSSMDLAIDATHNFNDSLQYQWMTTDVLTQTLAKYSDETTEIGKKAYAAAQDVKTFSMMMDTLKEAAQSGWAQTWELIVGDFEEAKSFWTTLSQAFGAIIDKSSELRNTFVKNIMLSNTEKLYEKLPDYLDAAGLSMEKFEEVAKNFAIEKKVKGYKQLQKEEITLQQSLRNGWLTRNRLVDIVKEMEKGDTDLVKKQKEVNEEYKNFQKLVKDIWSDGSYKNDRSRIKALEKEGYNYNKLKDIVSDVNKGQITALKDLSDTQLKNLKYTDQQIATIKGLSNVLDNANTPIGKLADNLERIGGRDSFINIVQNIAGFISQISTSLKQGFIDAFGDNEATSGAAEVLSSLSSMSDKLILTSTSMDNLVRSAKGLYAIFQILTTFNTNILVIGLNVLRGMLGLTAVDLLDITARVGDALVALRNLILRNKIFENSSEAISKAIVGLIEKVTKLVQAFWKLDAVQGVVNKFKKGILTIIDAFKQAYAEASKAGKNVAEGFKNGFLDGVSAIFGVIKDFCVKFIELVKAGFDMHSPSKKMYVLGTMVLLGFIYGFRDKIAEYVPDSIKELFNTIKNSLGEFNFSKLFAGAISLGSFYLVKKAFEAFRVIGSPMEGLAAWFNSLASTTKHFNKLMDAKKLELQASALMKLAIAIGILTASMLVISKIPKDDLKKSILVLGGLAVILVGMSIAIKKFAGSIEVTKEGITGLKATSFLAIAASITMMVKSFTKLAKLEWEEIGRGFVGMTIVVTAFIGFIAAFTAVSKKLDVAKLKISSSSLIGIAIAVTLMSQAVKAASKLTKEEIIKGGAIVAGMAVFFVEFQKALTKATLFDKNIFSKAKYSLTGAAVSMMLMVGVIKAASHLTAEEVVKGGAIIAGIGTFFVVLARALNNAQAGAIDTKGLGTYMLGLSTALIAMSLAMKTLGSMSIGELGKGIAAITVISTILTIFYGVVSSIETNGGKAAMLKFAGIMISMALTIDIISVALVTLSQIDGKKLQGAVTAVGFITLFFTALLVASQYAQGATKAIAVIGGCLVALILLANTLSILDEKQLQNGVLAVVSIIGSFGLLVLAVSKLTVTPDITVTLIALTAAIGLVVSLVGMINDCENPEGAAKFANSMALMIVAFSACLAALKFVAPLATGAVGTIGILVGVVAVFAVIIDLLVKDIGKDGAEAAWNIAKALSLLIGTFTVSLALLGVLSPLGIAAAAGAGALMITIGVLAAVCKALVDYEALFTKGVEILDTVATGLGKAFGDFIGAYQAAKMEKFSAALDSFGDTITAFDNAMSTIDDGAIGRMQKIVGVLNDFAEAKFMSKKSESIGGNHFIDELPELGTNLHDFVTNLGTLTEEQVTSVGAATSILNALSGLKENVSYTVLASLLKASEYLDGIGQHIGAYINQLKTQGVDDEGAKVAKSATKILNIIADASNTLEGGFFDDAQDAKLAAWDKLETIGNGLAGYINSLLGIQGLADGTALQNVKSATDILVQLASIKATPSASLGNIVSTLTGDQSLITFMEAFKGEDGLGNTLKGFIESLSNCGLNDETAASNVKNAVDILNTLAGIKPAGTEMWGQQTLAKFAEGLPLLGEGLSSFIQSVQGYDTELIDNAVKSIESIALLGGKKLDPQALEKFGKSFVIFATDVSTVASDTVAKASQNLVDFVKNLGEIDLKDIVTKTSKISKSMSTLATDSIAALGDKFEKSWDSIKSSLDTTIGKAADNIDTTDMKSAGKDLIDGLIKGLEDKAKLKAVYDAAYKLGQKAVAGEKAGQQSSSPSKATIKAGHWFGEGLVIGIGDMMSKVSTTAKNLGSKATNSLSNSMSTLSDLLSLDIDTQPVISPILDLDNLKNDVRSMNNMMGLSTPRLAFDTINAIDDNMTRLSQNGVNRQIISAIDGLRESLGNSRPGDTYNINGVTYDDGSNVANAVGQLISTVKMERRI